MENPNWNAKAVGPAQEKKINLTRVMKMAGATALRDMRAEAKKRVRDKKRVKAKAVAKALHIERPKRVYPNAPAAWALNVEGGVLRVSDYPHRQNRIGVGANINKGTRSLLKSAFVATMASGHKGVFIREATATAAQPRNRRRRSNRVGRLPIREPVASRPVDLLRQPGQAQAVAERGLRSFVATFERVGPGRYNMLPSAMKARIE